MKILIIDRIKDNSEYVFFFALLLLGMLYTNLSPILFTSTQPDSQSYINNDPIRTFLYPIIIDLFYNVSDSSFKALFLFQNFLLVISVLSLIFSLKSRMNNNYFVFFLYFFILSNFYYTSFAKTVLTESIFFSFINFSVALLINKIFLFRYKFLSIIFGLLLGGIIYIKSVGLVISILFFFIFVYKCFNYKNFSCIFFFLIGLIPMVLFENTVNQNKGDKINSVFFRSLNGKIFMLCGSKDFDLSLFKKEFSDYILIFINESKKINLYLDKLDNPFLVSNLKSDYETVGQYQFDKKLSNLLEKYDSNNIDDLKIEITFNIIRNYPLEYLKLSLWHYLGLWAPGGKHLFLNYSGEVPFQNMLKESSGEIFDVERKKLLVVLLFFTILLCIFSFATIRAIYYVVKSPIDKDHTITFLIISCQIYLATVCLTNVSTPRYLMPFYPLIIIIICIFIKDLFNYLHKKIYYDVEIK